MKTSTSRSSNVKHSTGNNEVTAKKGRCRRPHPRASTGEKATIIHFTGRSSNLKREKQAQEAKATNQKPSKAA